jgi:hypothetical protein
MAEGINMGRKSPWTKDEYLSLYKKVDAYGARLAAQLMIEEGTDSAAEAKMSYSLYKCPIVYLFIHYHYGRPEDLLNGADFSLYLMMFLPQVKYFAKEMRDAFASGKVFINDTNMMNSTLAKMCDEIIYIEENF